MWRFSFFLILLVWSFLLPTLSLSVASPVYAAGLIPCGRTDDPDTPTVREDEKCTLCHLIVGINEVIKLIRNTMTALALVVIVAMGFIYITSAGSEERMQFAKKGITAALVGFAIIILAWLVVNFIFSLDIYKAGTGLIRVDWDTLKCDTTSTSNP